MSSLSGWTRGEHTADVRGRPTTHPTYRRGTGPVVIVIHEIPGLTNAVADCADEVVEALPHGCVAAPVRAGQLVRTPQQHA